MQYFKTGIDKPSEFISCGLFVSDSPWIHANRIVESFELIIGINQCLYISQGEVEYEVNPGDVLLLLPGQVHEGYKLCDAGVSFYWLHFLAGDRYEFFNEEDLSHQLSKLNKPDASTYGSEVYMPLFSTPRRIERINILFQQLLHVVSSNYYTHQAANYLTTSLFIELSEQMILDYSSSSQSQSDYNISEIVEWIRIHALADISAADVASKFTYNKDYLSRFFKQKTGFNLQEYIHLMKMAKAKDLLTRSMRSIKDISEQVGIQDEKYFMRLFKRYENMTPTEYRKAYYKIHMNNQ